MSPPLLSNFCFLWLPDRQFENAARWTQSLSKEVLIVKLIPASGKTVN
jgi:hypothetical protein